STVVVTNPGGATATLPSGFTYLAAGLAATPPGPAGSAGPALSPAGGLFVFRGGTNADLVRDSGCSASTSVFWTTDRQGNWVGYIPAVTFALVNAPWNGLFPGTIPAGTPIYAHC